MGGVAVLIALAAIAAVVAAQGSSPPAGPGGGRSTAPSPSPSTAAPSVQPSGGPSLEPGPAGFPTIDGVRCDPTEQITFHVHARLLVRVNGQLQTIPGDIGQRSTCIYWLHTHQTDGIIHVEAPAPTAFTLGQFFDVWGKSLDATEVGDWPVPPGSKVWAFVNRTAFEGDPRTIELGNLQSIELQIGPSPIQPAGG